MDKIQKYNLFDCIECGCCAYVCPSNIPLVQYYRFAKSEIWDSEREREKSNHARDRFEFRKQRLEREKAEKAARHQQKKAQLKEGSQEADPETGKVPRCRCRGPDRRQNCVH